MVKRTKVHHDSGANRKLIANGHNLGENVRSAACQTEIEVRRYNYCLRDSGIINCVAG